MRARTARTKNPGATENRKGRGGCLWFPKIASPKHSSRSTRGRFVLDLESIAPLVFPFFCCAINGEIKRGLLSLVPQPTVSSQRSTSWADLGPLHWGKNWGQRGPCFFSSAPCLGPYPDACFLTIVGPYPCDGAVGIGLIAGRKVNVVFRISVFRNCPWSGALAYALVGGRKSIQCCR